MTQVVRIYVCPEKIDDINSENEEIKGFYNEIRKLPNDLSQLAQIEELNLTGNPIDNLQLAVESLVTMPMLYNLHTNLH